VSVPEPVAALVRGRPQVGREEQVFPFLTVDDDGHPHVALLSRAELDTDATGDRLLAAVAATTTGRNLRRDGRAGLIAVEGTTAHELKLELVHVIEDEAMLGLAFEVVEHEADSLGIPLEPMRFHATDRVAALERWDHCAELLAQLGAAVAG
jgi:hypothetical protein